MTGKPAFDMVTELDRLAASIVLGTIIPSETVQLAVTLVAAGVHNDGALSLSMLPIDDKRLQRAEVEPLARAMLQQYGVQLPAAGVAGWQAVEVIAAAIVSGGLDVVDGSRLLWGMWEGCEGDRSVLVTLLQLLDAWEEAVGSRRADLEHELQLHARLVRNTAQQRTDRTRHTH